jgi:hypothetical protein
VRCIGVFDTVGALGIPGELAFGSKKIKTLFGFSDSVLGDHIERAYQALALNETRADFVLLSRALFPAYANVSIGLQQVPAIRRGKEENAGFEAGTINATPMLYKPLRLVRSVGLLVSTNVSISRGS